jgi:hypothetical protein
MREDDINCEYDITEKQNCDVLNIKIGGKGFGEEKTPRENSDSGRKTNGYGKPPIPGR